MFIKQANIVQQTALRKPSKTEKAWVDQGFQDLEETLALLHWNWTSTAAREVDPHPDRDQLTYADDLLVLSVFTPEGDHLLPFSVILGPGIMVTRQDQPIQVIADLAKELPTNQNSWNPPIIFSTICWSGWRMVTWNAWTHMRKPSMN